MDTQTPTELPNSSKRYIQQIPKHQLKKPVLQHQVQWHHQVLLLLHT